jgi:hypothetical protein
VYVRDTLIPRCEACAARVDSLVSQARAERRASDTLVSRLQGELSSVRRRASRQKALSRFGVSVGYGFQVQGHDVKVGPVLGVGLRVLP